MCELRETGWIALAIGKIECASSDAHRCGGSKTKFFCSSEEEILLSGAILAGDARECDGDGAAAADLGGVSRLEILVGDGKHARVDGHVGELAEAKVYRAR